jgi:hypothetical protein
LIRAELSLIDVLLYPDLWQAGTIYIILAILITLGTEYIRSRLTSTVLLWQWEHIAAPLMRIILLLIFIALGYPVIFGLQEAPSLGVIMSGEGVRPYTLINLLFLSALLFPLIPVIGNWQALILPLQGILASALIFGWLAREQGLMAISYWPGVPVFLSIVALACLTHYLALALAHHFGNRLDAGMNVHNSGEFMARSTILVLQSPAILVYSLALGRQLL